METSLTIVALPKATKDALRAIKASEGTSMNELVRQAVAQYLAQRRRKPEAGK